MLDVHFSSNTYIYNRVCVPEVLVIVVALAKLSMHLLGEFLDDDIDVLTKRVIIVNTTGYLSHTLEKDEKEY